ncbi:MAG: hypothetical protein AB7L28_08615, partial [Kofleriaceae bacterium]
MDSRLQAAISNPQIQTQVGELIRLALRALEDLKSLDESLYERFVKSRNQPEDPEASARELGDLWDSTFSGLLQMLAFCRSLEGFDQTLKPVSDEPVELDLGEAGPTTPPLGSGDEGLGDLGDFLEGIDETIEEGDAERWAKVMEKVSSIEYGLRIQYQSGESRLTIALGKGETNQVLGLFDDTQSSACEGVHALVSAIYEGFVTEVNSQAVVPGYLTSLGRALLVRRGLAELTAAIGPHNAVLQEGGKTPDPEALEAVRTALHGFVSSIVCRAMRAADRWQMVEFDRELSEQSPTEARLTCEGLLKYLESLNSINQREVLLVHDHNAIDQMRDSLANARQLLELSPRTALEMVDQAYQAAQRLRGRHPTSDRLIAELEHYARALATRAE